MIFYKENFVELQISKIAACQQNNNIIVWVIYSHGVKLYHVNHFAFVRNVEIS